MLPNWIYYFLGKKSGGDTPSGKFVVPNGLKFGSTSQLPEDFESWDFSNVTDGKEMFKNATMTSCPNFENSQMTTHKDMFNGCRNLKTVGNFSNEHSLDTNEFNGVFYNCQSLETIGVIQLYPWNRNLSLKDCFSLCYQLKDFTFVCNWEGNGVYMEGKNLFNNCQNLSDHALDNILYLCTKIKPSGSNPGSLGFMGVNSKYDEIIPTLPHYQEFINAGWTIR